MKKIILIIGISFALMILGSCSSPKYEEVSSESSQNEISNVKLGTKAEEVKSANLSGKSFSYDEYIVCQKDGRKYLLTVAEDAFNCTAKLFDADFNELRTIELGAISGEIELSDVNQDGYMDIVTNIGGTINEAHELYIWSTESDNFVKAKFEGFEMLSWFRVCDGYIENFIRGSSPENSRMEYLVWDGSTLIKER